MSIKVSVITVCYNSEATIARTIESVLNQTYENIEYIIVDGASTDGTMDIVKSYEDKFRGRLRYVSEPDNGIYYAMNKGIDMATGELVGIINSDDWYEPSAVEIMAKRYEELKQEDKYDDHVILYGRLCTINGDSRREGALGSHERLREAMIAHPTCFVSKALYRDLGDFDTRYVSASDYDFMLRMQESGKVHFEPVDALIADFSLGGMCSTGKAYYDLLRVKKAHGIMSGAAYYFEYFKCRIYDLLHG